MFWLGALAATAFWTAALIVAIFWARRYFHDGDDGPRL